MAELVSVPALAGSGVALSSRLRGYLESRIVILVSLLADPVPGELARCVGVTKERVLMYTRHCRGFVMRQEKGVN